jgi:hypothetical protein
LIETIALIYHGGLKDNQGALLDAFLIASTTVSAHELDVGRVVFQKMEWQTSASSVTPGVTVVNKPPEPPSTVI